MEYNILDKPLTLALTVADSQSMTRHVSWSSSMHGKGRVVDPHLQTWQKCQLFSQKRLRRMTGASTAVLISMVG